MKKILLILAVFGLILGFSGLAIAANSDTQTVTFSVAAINEISITGAPTLVVDSATAGSEPNDDTDATTTYAITTNETVKKITGVIEENMPANVTLKIALVAPSGGSSEGIKTLSTAPVDLVTSIETVADGAGNTITYTLSATVAAGVVTSDTRIVTLTLTNE